MNQALNLFLNRLGNCQNLEDQTNLFNQVLDSLTDDNKKNELISKVSHKYPELQLKSSVSDQIYDTFEVGHRYLSRDVIQILSSIYKDYGIIKTAKSKDLLNWFEVKPTLVPDENKKMQKGYRLIKKLDFCTSHDSKA